MQASPLPVRLGPQGRVVVPAALRRELGLVDGSELAIWSDGRRLILEPKSEVLRRVRGRFADVPRGVSLAEELLAERLDESAREDSG